MWEPVTLPFQNDSLPLPTLPTTDEIRACRNILWERSTCRVAAVNDEIVVKYGTTTSVSEGQALVYLERYVPKVPAPRLYAMYYDSNQLFLVMQRVPGVQLDKIWDSLTQSEKDDIVGKLRHTFDAMRQAECPGPDFFGDHRHLGPFYGEAAFFAGLVGNFRVLTERNHRPDFKVRYYETYFTPIFQGHRPTLTHGDVQGKNIMVVENTSRRNEQGERSFDVVLVDWETAGWLPGYWEWFVASSPLKFSYWEEDWCWRVQEFLQVYPAETALMQMIDKDLGW